MSQTSSSEPEPAGSELAAGPLGFLDLDSPAPVAPGWDHADALELLLWCSSSSAAAALSEMLSGLASGLPGVFRAIELVALPSPLSGALLVGWVLEPSQEPFLAGLAAALDRAPTDLPPQAWLRLQRPAAHPDALEPAAASFWVLGPGGFARESAFVL